MRTCIEDVRIPINYSPRFREYSIEFTSGHRAIQLINYCPWCGAALPPSPRDEYFDALEPLDIAIVTDLDEIPPDYRDDAWWREPHTP